MVNLIIGSLNAYFAYDSFKNFSDKKWSTFVGWLNLIASAANIALFLKNII
jgi:hypothetical protein